MQKHYWEKVIAGLLATRTQEQAAALSGVSVITVKRCVKDPEFAARLQAKKEEMLQGSIDRASAACAEAVEELRKGLKQPGERVAAAKAIFDFVLKSRAANFEERLSALERRASEPAHTLRVKPFPEPGDGEV